MDNPSQPTYKLGAWVWKEDWPLFLAMAGAFITSAVLYPTLPEKVPIHWDINDQVNGWGSRFEALFLSLGMAVGIYLLILFIPLIDPRRRNYTKFGSSFRIIRFVLVLFMLLVWGATIAAARGMHVNMNLLMPAAISILLIVMGNVMPRLRHNWFIGVRTPWSLSSEEAWRKTHRVAGMIFVACGTMSLLATISFGGKIAAISMMVAILGASFGSLVYSYFAWKSCQKDSPENSEETPQLPPHDS